MPVICQNPACGRSVQLPDDLSGKRVKCPGCGQPLGSATATPKSTTDASRRATPVSTTPVEKVGRFVVRAKLGEGAFGAVYRAYDPHLDREVALKVPHAAVLDSPKRVERFLREAKAAANLRHPHIVPVFDAGTDGGKHYIASAFIDGQKLADAVEESDGGLDTDRAARLVRELAEALAYAHEQGIVHRDVKPDNVMLDAQDRVHLMDFGLAMKQDAEARLTNDGAVMGTPSYMSPEQAKGETAAVGPAADQYACGVVLYELLTGQTPFSGPIPVVLHHQIHTDPEPPKAVRRAIPKDLETVCLKALRKNPAERYANCQELADDLRRWQEGEPVSARRQGAVEKAMRWVRKNAAIVFAVSAVLFVLLAGTSAVAVFAQQASIDRLKADEALRQKAASDESAKDAADLTSGALGTAEEERQKAVQFQKQAEKADADARKARGQADESNTATGAATVEAEKARGELEKVKQELEKAKQEAEKAKQEAEALKAKMVAKHGRVPLLVIRGPTNRITAAAYSKDGKRIVAGSEDRWAEVWDAQTGENLLTLLGEQVEVSSVAFNPDGTQIAVGSKKGEVIVWDAKTGKKVLTLDGHKAKVRTATFSPDGERIVTASDDKTAKVWDAKTGKVVFTFREHTRPVNSARFSPDGLRVLTASDDGTMKVWIAKTGKVIDNTNRSSAPIADAAFSPDASHIMAADGNDVKEWNELTSASNTLLRGFEMGHTRRVSSVVYSADGSRLASASLDGKVIVWGTRSGGVIFSITDLTVQDHSVAFHPDGSRILTVMEDRVAVWDAKTGKEVLALTGHTDSVNSATFSHDGTRIVTASDDRTARVWDAKTGAEVLTLKGHEVFVRTASFSHDGTRIVTASWADKTVRVWDAKTGKEVLALTGSKGLVMSAAFSPDGTRIVTASSGETVRVWDAKTGKEVLALTGHTHSVNSATFSHDGTRIVTASDDRTARVWDAKTGAEVLTLKGHEGFVHTASFSHDGTRIVTASKDRTARVWDAKTGAEVLTLKGHTDTHGTAALSPDGTRIVTASNDKTARVWDAKTGKEVLALTRSKGLVVSAAFSPDGTRIVTADSDNAARVWDAGPPTPPKPEAKK